MSKDTQWGQDEEGLTSDHIELIQNHIRLQILRMKELDPYWDLKAKLVKLLMVPRKDMTEKQKAKIASIKYILEDDTQEPNP